MLELLKVSIKYIIAAVLIALFIIAYSCMKAAGDADYKLMKMKKEGGVQK